MVVIEDFTILLFGKTMGAVPFFEYKMAGTVYSNHIIVSKEPVLF